mgnify:FL=1
MVITTSSVHDLAAALPQLRAASLEVAPRGSLGMPVRLVRIERWFSGCPTWVRGAIIAVVLGPFAVAAWLAVWRFAMKLVGIDVFPVMP